MLTELTVEQEAALDPFAQQWIDRLDRGAPLDEAAATAGIKFIYKLAGLAEPEVRFVASPKAAADLARAEQLAAGEEVDVRPCEYGSFFQDAGWVAFYSFFQDKCGIEIDVEGWEEFRALIESNLCECIQLEGLAIGCPMPDHVSRDSEGRLHSTGGKAIEWSDGYGIYSIHGVTFEEELFNAITNRTIASKDVLAISNIEQRMIALSFLGESVWRDLPARLMHESARGNRLFETEITGTKEYFLRYVDPSDGEEYVSFVDVAVGAEGNADAAMAWKFSLTPEEYAALEEES
jgi:hypothetical protein